MTTDSILAKDFVKRILSTAKKHLRIDGYLLPVLFVRLASGEGAILPLELPETSEKKQAYFRALGISIYQSGKVIQEALFLSEGWFVQTKKSPEVWNTVPSQHPARKMAINVIGRNVDGSRYTWVVQPFVRRKQGKLSWKPPVTKAYNEPSEKAAIPVGLIDFLFVSTMMPK